MDPLTLIMLAVLALLVFFMFRNGRKRKKDQENLQSTMVPGADVMTNFGLYGTIVSIDEEANKVALEIAPGTIVHIHRQTIARVVEPVTTEADTDDSIDVALDEQRHLDANRDIVMDEPEFGQLRNDTPEAEPKKGDA